MPRTKEQNESIRERTKLRIHTAAIKLFSEKDFAAASVQDIATEAGISVGLMYRHYKTKEDVFEAIAREAMSGLDDAIKLFDSGDPLAAITAFTDEIVNDFNSGDGFSRLMAIITKALEAKTAAWVDDIWAFNKNFTDGLTKLILDGQKIGVFYSGDARVLAQHYLAVIQGISTVQMLLCERFIPPTTQIILSFLVPYGK